MSGLKEHSRPFADVFLNRPDVGIWSMFSQPPICCVRFRRAARAERWPNFYAISLLSIWPPGEGSSLRRWPFFPLYFSSRMWYKIGGHPWLVVFPRVFHPFIGRRSSPMWRASFCYMAAMHRLTGKYAAATSRQLLAFLPMCTSPKCKICTSNYTLNATTGENISPPLLSKPKYDFQDRFWAVFFYFFKKIFGSAE